MGTFTYTAKKERGALFTGEAMGDSKAAVVAELRRKGLTVVSLEEKRGVLDLKTMLENSKRISVRDKAVFARQFATMINSGLAVLRALYVLEEQTQNPRLQEDHQGWCATTSKRACRSPTPWPSIRPPSTGSTSLWCEPARRAARSTRRSSAWPLSWRSRTACAGPSSRP